MFLSILTFFILAGSLVSRPFGVSAQISAPVQCDPSYSWAFNSHQQSPCAVAAYLRGACNGGLFSVDPLAANSFYVGPGILSNDPCECNTVVYSLISACGDCQNRSYVDWSYWSTNCSTSFLSTFPVEIPRGTSVPAWAYLDVVTSNKYSPALARADSNLPESSASLPTTSTTHSPSGSITGVIIPTAKPSRGSNVGAIAGGVLGGIAGMGLLAGLGVYLFLRRRRAHTAPSAAYNSLFDVDRYSSLQPTSQEYSQYGQAPYKSSTPDMAGLVTVPRLYDPADPSTYPASAGPTTLHTGSSVYHESSYGAHPAPPPRGAYSGVPEI